MTRYIYFVGKPYPKEELLDKIHDFGYQVGVLQDKDVPIKHPARYDSIIELDFTSDESLAKSIEQKEIQAAGLLCCYENYVLPAAIIAKRLNLPGMPIESAQACTDKYLMRQLFAKSDQKISPDFDEVNDETDLKAFMENHNFPVILKPANLAKSLLVTKNNSYDELLTNYRKTVSSIKEVYLKYAPHRTPKIVIEEFMVGPIHSVDAFVDANGTPHVLEQIVDYQTGYDVGYDDNFHYSRLIPSKLSADEIEQVRTAAAAGCRALGMKSSPAHIEIIRTANGPMIVEIGARNGGYRERMHGLANGIDITGNAIRIALGELPEIKATRNDHCAVIELFPKQPGTFESISHEDELKKLPSLKYYSLKAIPGNFVGKSSDGYKMCAIVMLHNPDKNQFEQDLRFVNDNVRVITIA